MEKFAKVSLFLLRISLGWLFFYAGITKVLDPNWSAGGFLGNAQNLPGFFSWLASPAILPVTNFLNEWGLTLIGASLVLGLFVRISSFSGAILMLLYYLAGSELPFVEHGFLVDDHVVYIFALLYFAAVHAGRIWGLENWCSGLPICRRFPKLRNWLG